MVEIRNRTASDNIISRWYVYMLRCADNSLYTGISTDVARRVMEHNQTRRAAAYTRARRPVVLVYTEVCPDRSGALKREHAIRRMSAAAKAMLINGSQQ